MSYYGRRFGDVEEGLISNGILGTFEENNNITLLGFYNEIKLVGYLRFSNPKDIDKIMDILKDCGYNYCRKKSDYCIEVMYDTSRDDWGVKVNF